MNLNDMRFEGAVRGLMAGDFSRLEPLFKRCGDGADCSVVQWHGEGLFEEEPKALAEAFTCACFNGCTDVVEYFLGSDADPAGGAATGLNAFHWAANRGQLEVVKLLIGVKAPMEIRNSYGGTVLDCAVWSAIHEPRSRQIEIIDALVKAGADVEAVDYPTGHAEIDEILRRRGTG